MQSGRQLSCYASAPNDVWSLGVILVNLTCGRNPWKRASPTDSTFRAYLKNSRFLRTILPLSPELDSILRRIFEVDPMKRITIRELRQRIIACQRFTTSSGADSEVSDASEPSTPDIHTQAPAYYTQVNAAPIQGALTPPYQQQHEAFTFGQMPATPPVSPPLTPATDPCVSDTQFQPLISNASPPVVVSHTQPVEYQTPVTGWTQPILEGAEKFRSHFFANAHLVSGPQGVQCF